MNLGLTMRAVGISLKKALRFSNLDCQAESMGMLLLIDYNEDIIQQHMADFMKKDKSVILRQIDSMEEKGFIKRIPDSTDRRKNILVTTEKGKEQINLFQEIEQKLLIEFTRGISEEDLKTFNRVLMHIKKNAENI